MTGTHAAGFAIWSLLLVTASSAAAVASFILLVREGEGQLCDCVVQQFELRGHVICLLLRGVVNAGGKFIVLFFLGDGHRGNGGHVST